MNNDDLTAFKKVVIVLVAVAVVSIILLLALYTYNFMALGKADQESFAQFGDYFGGVLNPIFGFLTIVLLIYSIRIQSKELRVANEELGLARQEMQVANKEARKSADAMSLQTKHIQNRAQIEEIHDVIKSIKNEKKVLDDVSWYIPTKHLENYYDPYAQGHLTIGDLHIHISNRLIDAEKEGDEDVFEAQKAYIRLANHKPNSFDNLYLLAKHIRGYGLLLLKYNKCICQLIRLGCNQVTCQELVDHFCSIAADLEEMEVVSSALVVKFHEALIEYSEQRCEVDDGFGININCIDLSFDSSL